ncbi:bifunctional alpha,alpha-trehalose-phosphate synthase (UDP-forming)/trehalose-phosphatase [Salinimicrobium oceani]|uniref:Alpha,alpha-trehalose-phosphate synthase n=1 Tax=Salinimicrobium oceani TaxID=2722702 RepID=A0ABX1CWZ8_9FLAO|nr:bifunctional alpha,alpha-trehalose-phosphate synthase (UDP-forming)/trehalose-phosphatase [Salinimicrobium oceani]NJW52803.1 bifunctional alpha,alpha-trehalose-phosphate synthase (UDP-forming)/trehalose-phosphatase [Salinimicrobium oceani]
MGKTIIVSNRLPLQINITENNELEVTPSVGGLATGLKSFHQEGDSIWIGWTGIAEEDIPDALEKEVIQEVKNQDCIPVSLTSDEIEKFYYGFSNRTIWPLFHYFMEFTEFDPDHWEAYKAVNKKYAEAVIERLDDDDVVWVHDYQLLLLPEYIRRKKPNVTIGFFNHIPFPSSEVFRTLPWREEVLRGMLGADLIGFHTYDYERHFLRSVNRILRYDINFNSVNIGNRIVRSDSFPMGIDYKKFHKAAKEHKDQPRSENSDIQKKLDYHKYVTRNTKLILSIDRLDYTKGIANRIRAFGYFLEKYPEYQEKVRLIMLAVPSRTNVPQYQLLKKEIDELVGRINGKFATINWTPIWYFYRAMPFENLIDLYASSDVALITPTRDGMNLVAKEYIATRTDQTGVLILSEMAGAAHELNEALIINPNNFEQIVDTMKMALEMPEEEQIRRNKILQKRLKRYNVERWASDFMKSLRETKDSRKAFKSIQLNDNIKKDLFDKYSAAQHRILFLDYDGTLRKFVDKPDEAHPDADLLDLIGRLGEQKNTRVVIISGRDKETLGNWWKNLPIELISEHGVWNRPVDKEWQLTENLNNSWMSTVRPVLETFVDRTPGTFIEEKNFSLAWHYRKANPELGEVRANELSAVLKDMISNHGLSVLQGNKVLEIKNSGVNKGKAANKLLVEKYDFIFAIGDDWTDEYLFTELPDHTVSVKVGRNKTEAKYFIDDVDEVRALLSEFASLTR